MANEQNFKWLRSFGIAGSIFANGLQLLGLNIGLTVSAALGVIAAIWSAVTGVVLSPPVEIGVAAFLTVLWTWIGVTVLRDRKRPREVFSHQDYKYGLTYEGILPVFVPNDETGGLQFHAQFRNFSAGPIRYSIDVFNVRIDTRSLPPIKKGDIVTYLPRGAARVSRNVPFKMKDIREFLGSRVTASVDVTVAYGHPEREPERQLTMQLEFELTFPAPDNPDQRLGVSDKIVSERDEPYVTR